MSRRLLSSLVSVALAILLALAVPLPEHLSTGNSVVVYDQGGEAIHVELSPDEKWRIAAELNAIDPDYLAALLAIEDERFYYHPGVDPVAIGRATLHNAAAGTVVSGASTLTMQLARMLEPRPRTLWSKGIEAARAVQVELRFSKEEILAAYLTFVPFGKNVEGIHAAAFWYFGHDARALSPAEIATLLAVPQSPSRRYPSPGNQERLRVARDDIAERLYAAGLIAKEDLEVVRQTAVPDHIRSVPRDAPHAARFFREQRPGRTHLDTTLDAGLQRLVERKLSALAPELRAEGIYNAAVVVVDHQTAEIRALVGNLDFWDRAHGGQILAFQSPRSPGSALKPFLYAAAIDAGKVLPVTLVSDVPVAYGSYNPENYDGTWAGMVQMQEALARSLNIPFVQLLRSVGVDPFLGLLRRGGVSSLDPSPGYYGLSLIVGGVEVTPLELAALYTALADDGRYRPLVWSPAGERAGTQLLSPGAAWLTRQTLRLRDRPDFPSRHDLVAVPSRIHWKTGTSFGNRDAWAAGSGERYTAVVWLGNLDRSPSSALVGGEVAAPLLFDLLEGARDQVESPDPPPLDLIPVKVCPLSGHIPGASCPEAKETLAVGRAVPTERCSLHVTVEIDEATGLSVTPPCRGDRTTHVETVVAWPPEVRRWLGESYTAEATVPARAPDCPAASAGAPPTIRSPEANATVLLIPGLPAASQEVPLQADATDPGEKLTWFVDGARVGAGGAGETVWWEPRLGKHVVLVMDGGGRSAEVGVEVREKR